MDVAEIGLRVWIGLVQDSNCWQALENMVMNLFL
jgi:hypothetical protein